MTNRRDFLTVSMAALGGALAPRGAGAAPKAMSVVHESSFIKGFDDFFVQKLAPAHEKLTGIKINYEPVLGGSMLTRLPQATPERAPPGVNWPYLFDAGLVDLTDVANEIGKKLGGWHDNIYDAVV